MNVSPEARDQISTILSTTPDQVFRVALVGGGCAGFQYHFDLTAPKDDDVVIEEGIVIDPISNGYLSNATLGYKNEVFLKSFFLESPDITSTCGCGVSVGF